MEYGHPDLELHKGSLGCHRFFGQCEWNFQPAAKHVKHAAGW